VVEYCAYGNEPLAFISDREFVEQLSDYSLIKDSVLVVKCGDI
jgi:hypothetical protein